MRYAICEMQESDTNESANAIKGISTEPKQNHRMLSQSMRMHHSTLIPTRRCIKKKPEENMQSITGEKVQTIGA